MLHATDTGKIELRSPYNAQVINYKCVKQFIVCQFENVISTGGRNILRETLHPDSLPRIQQLEELAPLPVPEMEQQFGPPHFVTMLNSVEGIKENATAHLECRLEPARDPTVKVEWFLNGRPLPAGKNLALNNTSNMEYHIIQIFS